MKKNLMMLLALVLGVGYAHGVDLQATAQAIEKAAEKSVVQAELQYKDLLNKAEERFIESKKSFFIPKQKNGIYDRVFNGKKKTTPGFYRFHVSADLSVPLSIRIMDIYCELSEKAMDACWRAMKEEGLLGPLDAPDAGTLYQGKWSREKKFAPVGWKGVEAPLLKLGETREYCPAIQGDARHKLFWNLPAKEDRMSCRVEWRVSAGGSSRP